MITTLPSSWTCPLRGPWSGQVYAHAATLDDATGDLIRDAVAVEGGIDALPALPNVIPGQSVADIVLDAIAREAVDGVALCVPRAILAA